MAMTNAANQAAWYQTFLVELGYSVNDPIPLHGHNKGAIVLRLGGPSAKACLGGGSLDHLMEAKR